jgi:hypothetical protein
MSLLTIVQNAARRLGITAPSVVISSSDQNVIKLLGLSNQGGRELARRANWQALTKEKTFTSLAQESQTGAIPADFDRVVNDTLFNRTRKRKVLGPLTPQQWQLQKSVVASVVTDSFRIRGNAILILPSPSAGDTYAYEYLSSYWVDTDQDGTGDATAWAADDDTSLVDEELLTLDLVWRFLKANGLDYAEAFNTFEAQAQQIVARDGAKTLISLAGDYDGDRARYPGVQEGSWSL